LQTRYEQKFAKELALWINAATVLDACFFSDLQRRPQKSQQSWL
jgi:hypothetical protein